MEPKGGLVVSELKVSIEQLSLGDQILVKDLEFCLQGGQVLSLMGASGSGKSSILAFIAGFLDPAFRVRGTVWLDGQDISGKAPEQRHMSLLFQDPLLFAHMSVGQNLRFGMPRELSRQEKTRRLRAALAGADLEGFEDRDPARLSGGQKARVALLRALLSEPQALLLDEPFSKLDSHLRQAFRAFVLQRTQQAGLPVILVTHDEQDAQAMGGACLRLGVVQS